MGTGFTHLVLKESEANKMEALMYAVGTNRVMQTQCAASLTHWVPQAHCLQNALRVRKLHGVIKDRSGKDSGDTWLRHSRDENFEFFF